MQMPHINRHVTVYVKATWHETICTHKEEDLSLATKYKCSLQILTWFTYIIVHNNKHKIPLNHFNFFDGTCNPLKSSGISSMLRVRSMKFRGLFPVIPDPSRSSGVNRFCAGRGLGSVEASFFVQNGGDMSCVFCGKNHIWSPVERMFDRWTTPSPPGCFIWQFCRKVVAKSWCCGMKILYFLNLIL